MFPKRQYQHGRAKCQWIGQYTVYVVTRLYCECVPSSWLKLKSNVQITAFSASRKRAFPLSKDCTLLWSFLIKNSPRHRCLHASLENIWTNFRNRCKFTFLKLILVQYRIFDILETPVAVKYNALKKFVKRLIAIMQCIQPCKRYEFTLLYYCVQCSYCVHVYCNQYRSVVVLNWHCTLHARCDN